jgi:hypothetical protein
MNEADDDNLRYIEKVEYRSYTIKIARRGDEIKLLIYLPDALLAAHIFTDRISNYEEALDVAKIKIDRLIRDVAK